MSERGSFTKGDRDGVGQVEQLQQHLANFEPSSEQTEQQEEAQTGVESLRPVNDDTEAANEIAQQEPRKGERVRRLTEKGRELRDERWRQLEHRFRVSYEKWKALVKEAKLSLTGCCSEDLLEDLLNKISHTSTELNLVYVNLRQIDIPDNDIRRRVDTCEAVTMSIIKTVRCHLKGREEGQSNQIELHWKDSNSLCMSELSHKSSLNYQPSSASSQSQSNSKVNSRRSSVSSVKRQEAAAEVAANQAALEVMVKQERQLEELQRLEDEDKKRTAEQEAEAVKRSLEEARLRVKLEVENAARRRTLEDKRRELERLEVLKKLNAAKARMQVYEQDENSEDEKRELLSNCKSVKEVTHRSGSFHSLSPQHVVTSTQQEDGTKTMFRLLAESISESRLPIPEPVTFNGEPLSYTDWKVSFQTLIDRKNIPTTEKIYYLRKYVGGPAKKAIESYFMLGTESAYHAAWTILEERYGNKFFIAKSFRDKLNAWPTIGSKDSLELRDLVDFLRSCEAAMSQNKGLEVLNDCNENQKILAKLPDWLTSRWNRKVTAILEETEIFPSFSQFVKFLTREAKIACNPTLESDFNERAAEEDLISQEDIRFLKKMKEGIRRKDNGHYEMPLPFKEERPNLPNNKTCAVHRLKCLERRLRRDKQYYKDYTAFMEETIACGDAEKVSKEEINKHPAWYIPHHGVYHPQKPGKIRVVFDCSAKFRESSLNDHLTGSEVTNTLLGVLCRFRKGPVAIMCDVECMFHQFHVKAEDQDYLRFLWWENGDLESQPSAYRMMVHLFGAASSPGCANYGLKHLAAEGQGSFSEKSIQFIERNFYVDDGLTSVSSEAEAAQLGKEARELCSIGKLRLHKFISNSKEVIATIPKEERAKGAKDLDMALGEPHMERALGVLWCVA
uniref:uncharacterized protein LOC124010653 n=1 Tax=Oncorhynchus gorbuscha TaxID=8017 RepID=UPI001EAEC4D7|nr:uncharacterized protein LOC124010653 [Oncorhynchus gorbuscha]